MKFIMMHRNFAYDTYKSFDERLAETRTVLTEHPDRIPLIVEPIHKKTMELDKNKFLCPKDIHVANFLSILRNRLNLSATDGIKLFIGNFNPPGNMLMGDLYLNHKDKDNFLKMHYSPENFFGNI